MQESQASLNEDHSNCEKEVLDNYRDALKTFELNARSLVGKVSAWL